MSAVQTTKPEIAGAMVRVAGADQPEYQPITIALVSNPEYPYSNEGFNTIVSCFQPNDEQLRRLNAGEKIYVGLLTFGRMMQPILVTVGHEVWEDMNRLPSTRDS